MAHIKIIDSALQIKPVFEWAYTLINKGLTGGAVEITIGRHEEKRTIPQNKKGWAMWKDISNHLEWYGKKRSPRFWKEFLSSEMGESEIVPNANNTGFFVFGKSTSEMKVRELVELIELTYSFGSVHQVPWSEPAIAEYQSYKEAQQ